MNFYDFDGSLVRQRRIPVRQAISLERWNGTTWEPFAAIEDVARHGHRLSDERAIRLLRRMGCRNTEARELLRAPGDLMTAR